MKNIMTRLKDLQATVSRFSFTLQQPEVRLSLWN